MEQLGELENNVLSYIYNILTTILNSDQDLAEITHKLLLAHDLNIIGSISEILPYIQDADRVAITK